MELRFSRRHPYEPPKVVFPPVQGRNLKNPRHPNVDTAGKLWLRDLSHDSWAPIMTVSQIVSMVSSLFSVDPPSLRLNRGKGRAGGSASASSSAAALSPNSRQAADADADADADTAEAPCPMNNVSAETVFKLRLLPSVHRRPTHPPHAVRNIEGRRLVVEQVIVQQLEVKIV